MYMTVKNFPREFFVENKMLKNILHSKRKSIISYTSFISDSMWAIVLFKSELLKPRVCNRSCILNNSLSPSPK